MPLTYQQIGTAVAIPIHELRPPTGISAGNRRDAGWARNRLEGARQVAKQPVPLIAQGVDKQIRPAIVIVIARGYAHPVAAAAHPGGVGSILEFTIAEGAVQPVPEQ